MIRVYSASYAELLGRLPEIGELYTVVYCDDNKRARTGIPCVASNYPVVPSRKLIASYKSNKIGYEEFSREYLNLLSNVVNRECLYDDLQSLAYGNGTEAIALADEFDNDVRNVRRLIGNFLGTCYCGEL